ncbi:MULTISPECIES: hypothetical protein [unclassified Bradyrhizobium]|uniref:hypothetical protein n=1 Tax=unclassified Bradyrhizobium TaxID=2631580 RepID=UPI002916180B|nr:MULTISPECIES: hypothetical protein [unclassified Bradyrhizobium]
MTTTSHPEPSIFDGCESLDEIIALFLSLIQEPDELRQLLTEVDLDRESLETIAERLSAAGLPGASIVLEFTATAATKAEREIDEILADPLRANKKSRLREYYNRHSGNPDVIDALASRGITVLQ